LNFFSFIFFFSFFYFIFSKTMKIIHYLIRPLFYYEDFFFIFLNFKLILKKNKK